MFVLTFESKKILMELEDTFKLLLGMDDFKDAKMVGNYPSIAIFVPVLNWSPIVSLHTYIAEEMYPKTGICIVDIDNQEILDIAEMALGKDK